MIIGQTNSSMRVHASIDFMKSGKYAYVAKMKSVLHATVELSFADRSLWWPFYWLFIEVAVFAVPWAIVSAVCAVNVQRHQTVSIAASICSGLLFALFSWWRSAVASGVVLRAAQDYWSTGSMSENKARDLAEAKAQKLMIADWPEGISLALVAMSTFLPLAFRSAVRGWHAETIAVLTCLIGMAISTILASSVIRGSHSLTMSFLTTIETVKLNLAVVATFIVIFFICNESQNILAAYLLKTSFIKAHTTYFEGMWLLGSLALLPLPSLLGILPYARIFYESSNHTTNERGHTN